MTESDLEAILTLLDEKSEENLGCVMIFNLVNDVNEWFVKRSEKDEEEYKHQDQEDEEREKAERKKFEGTPVTRETFLAWKTKFDQELLAKKLEKQLELEAGPKRMTGREMFETDNTLIESDLNFVDDLDQENIDALLEDESLLDLTTED